MSYRLFRRVAILGLVACPPVDAATVEVAVTNSDGMPAANAVVSLAPDSPSAAIPPHAPARSVIDQRHETFLPLVTVVRKGGEVIFTNNDTTMHQVYSFSPIRQFQFEIDEAQTSRPVLFDKAGVAAIGCNIHDNMVAYIFVADAPYAAVTNAAGRAEFRDIPRGAYRAAAWHPQMRIGRAPPPAQLTVGSETVALALALPLTRTAMPDMSRHRKSDY